jgi:hypothetical protein
VKETGHIHRSKILFIKISKQATFWEDLEKYWYKMRRWLPEMDRIADVRKPVDKFNVHVHMHTEP